MRNPLGKLLSRLPLSVSTGRTLLPLVSLEELEQILQQVQEYTNAQIQRLPFLQQRMMGDLASRYLGSGMDYEESRLYQPGDELRFINWRMTARAGEFYTRLFREERKPCVYILLDRRLNMRFATHTRLKLAQAIRVAAIYAFMAHSMHIPVAGMTLDASSRPQRELTQLQEILLWLFQCGRDCPLPGDIPQEPTLSDALHLLQHRIPSGSRVLLISDFQELQEKDRSILQRIQLQNDVLALEIVDPAEMRLPHAGPVTLTNIRDGSAKKLDCDDPTIRNGFQHIVQKERDHVTRLLQECGIEHQMVLTGQDIAEILQQTGDIS